MAAMWKRFALTTTTPKMTGKEKRGEEAAKQKQPQRKKKKKKRAGRVEGGGGGRKGKRGGEGRSAAAAVGGRSRRRLRRLLVDGSVGVRSVVTSKTFLPKRLNLWIDIVCFLCFFLRKRFPFFLSGLMSSLLFGFFFLFWRSSRFCQSLSLLTFFFGVFFTCLFFCFFSSS